MLQIITLNLRWIFVFLIFLIINNWAFAKTDKYRCIWRDNPSTTMTIAWNQISGSNPTLYYDTYDNGTNVSNYTYQKISSKVVKAKGLNNNFVRLTNLQPNTKYYFIIKDSDSKSKRYWFQTAPDNSTERLSILAGGDSRNHRKGRQNANMMVAKLRPHCVVFGGDMTGLDIEREWKNWFDDWQLTIASDGRMTPIIAARGNHEKSNKTLVDLFDVPNESVYYALNLGGNLLRVYTLNTMIATGGDQKSWLQKDLNNSDNALWKMAQYHHPMRPHTAKKAEGTRLYKSWAKLFYDYNVQLVVECDAHVCKTTYPIRPTYAKGHDEGFVRDNKRGTVYVGEGCWGAPIRPANDAKSWTRATGSFNQIKWIWIDSEKIEIRTVKTDNALSVGKLSDATRFTTPSNINIWKPKTGAVITIKRRNNEPMVSLKPTKPKSSTIPKTKESSRKTTIRPKPKTNTVTQSNLINNLIIKDVEVVNEEKNATVKWKTVGEPSGAMCDLQRSIDGVNFTTVARLVLLGNTEKEQSYSLQDSRFNAQNAPFVYYRIRGTLPNGEEKFSTLEKIAAKKAKDFPILPLKDGNIYVEYELLKDGDVVFQITDDNGNFYKHATYVEQKKGKQSKYIDLSGIKSGQYILSIQLTDQRMIYYQIEI
ncbi:MAG: fibronectin type III domain-containing protein [Saprospiraceae bacterium]